MAEQEAGAKLRLKDFEKKIRLRPIRRDDYDALVDMQLRSFPGMKPWGRDQIESQLEVFPEGQLCIELDGRVVASSSSLVVDYERYEDWHDWTRIADAGYIRNHEPDGDTLYGIEIMVDPDFRGMHLARRLYDARKELCRRLNLARIVIGGRIPGFGGQPDEMTARAYVEKVTERGLYDPVLTTQVANGFVLKALIPDYFPSDTASRGYATHLEWTNLDYVPDPSKAWRRVLPVRLCAVQYQMRPIASWDEFCRQCAYFLDAAADQKADFVLFPELVTTQLLGLEADRRPADAVRALARRTPEYLEFFTRSAVKYNVNILGGSQFTLQDDRLYNIAYLFRRDGTIEQQAKLHVTPDERRWWGSRGATTSGSSILTMGRSPSWSPTTSRFPSSPGSPRAEGRRSCSCRSPPVTGPPIYGPGTRPCPGRWRTTSSWPSQAAPGTCPSWTTRTCTTPSRPSSRLWTSPSPVTASPPSPRPTWRPWSSPTSIWSSCGGIATPERYSPGPTGGRTCSGSSGKPARTALRNGYDGVEGGNEPAPCA